jgi:hypothetical protein
MRRAIPLFFPVLLLSAGISMARAQEPVKPDTNPLATQPPTNPPAPTYQEPGADAQVQTGSKFGAGSLMGRLARLLADHQVPEVENLLKEDEAAAPDTPGKLTPQQKQLLNGVLLNRENQPQESIHALQPLVDSLPANTDPAEQKLLRKSLAEDYLRAGEWAKAAAAYQAYAAKLGSALTPDEQAEIELPLKLLPLAENNPPMTVEPGDAFALPFDRDALGLTDIPVFVDAQSHDWMLDPTAPFNLICRSTARQVGLKVSEQSATVSTITGRPIQVHVTVIPRFTIGTVTYRNMTAFVFEDADYYFPKSKYQVRGVLGYPAVSALGSLTITADSRIEIQPGAKGERTTTGARFYLDGDRLLAALGKQGDERMYIIDAGGQQTYLTSRYYAEHSDDFANKKMELLSPPGEPAAPPIPTYIAESATLLIGATPASFQYLPVLTQPIAGAAIDDTYGTLGMDALDELKSYTFDYRTMRFSIRNE